MGEEVSRTLRGIAGELSLFGDVLVLGDSTSAYCVDGKCELSRGESMAKLEGECGVRFYFGECAGATPRDFWNQAENAAWGRRPCDWALLLGGWNSYGIDGGEVGAIFADFCAY